MLTLRHLRILLLLAVPLILMLVVSQTPVEPWGDEAMLLINLLVPELNLLRPLPYYEQAAPVGYLWVARSSLDLFGLGGNYHVLRFVSAAFLAGGIVLILLSRPLRRDGKAAAIFVGLVSGTSLIWVYAAEMKPYSADFFATALLLATGLPLVRSDKPLRLGIFLLVVLITGLISFTTPVVVAGVLATVAITRYTRRHGDAPAPGLSLPFVMAGSIAVLYLIAMYFLVNRGLVTYQMGAYAHVYRPEAGKSVLSVMVTRLIGTADMVTYALGSTWLGALRDALQGLGLPPGPSYHLVRLIGAGLFIVVLMLAARRSAVIALVSVCTFAAVALLQVAGLLSFPYARHVIFLMPIGALLMAIAGSALLDRLVPARAGVAVAALFLAAMLAYGVTGGLNRKTQELGVLLAHIEATAPETPVWVSAAAQTVLQVIGPRPKRVMGEFDMSSGPEAWAVRGGAILNPTDNAGRAEANPNYPGTIGDLASGEPALWLLFSTDGPDEKLQPFLDAAGRAVGACVLELAGRETRLFLCAAKE